MNTQDKAKALATLMHWKPGMCNVRSPVYRTIVQTNIGIQTRSYLEPYSESECGLAQFATILLKFPKAIMHYTYDRDKAKWLSAEDGEMFHGEPTQENLLDEILRMHGVME